MDITDHQGGESRSVVARHLQVHLHGAYLSSTSYLRITDLKEN